MDYFAPPNIKDVIAALAPLKDIGRPPGDNEGDPLNSPHVYRHLAREARERVDHAVQVAREYTRQPGDFGDAPNRRSLTTLTKNGFPAHLGLDQYDPYRLVGSVQAGEWVLDLSDPALNEDDEA